MRFSLFECFKKKHVLWVVCGTTQDTFYTKKKQFLFYSSLTVDVEKHVVQ